MKKVCAILLVMLCLCGCSIVGDIAGNVANAAVEELKTQVRQTLQSYKLEVLDVKTALGKLNGETDSSMQLFCAVLVTTQSNASLDACVAALDKVFEEAGYQAQTGRDVSHPHLVQKQLQYREIEWDADRQYYTVYAYSSDVSLKLPDLSGMIQDAA